MYFKSDEHRNMFNTLVKRAGQGDDCEYSAALYVIAALERSCVVNYVQYGEINFTALFRVAKAWSSSEKALLKLSATLFNSGNWSAKIGDVFYHLDENNCRMAIEALKIRYCWRGISSMTPAYRSGDL